LKNAITSETSEAHPKVIALFEGTFVPFFGEESEKNCFIADLNFTQDLRTSKIALEFAAGKAEIV
jgi:hypothetical protein